MPSDVLPDWDSVLSAAARLQEIVLLNLRTRFDQILAELESVAGWKTARVQRPVLILGSLDGIETGVRQLIRDEPLETRTIERGRLTLTLPTEAEILRIKAVLILRRNATRDYVDFAALADHIGDDAVVEALRHFDRLYSQPNGESALQQLQIQLASPLPYDLQDLDLSQYRNLKPKWHSWESVKSACAERAILVFDRIIGAQSIE